MADENRPPEEFPPGTFPVLYADGVTSIAPGGQVVKFYFGRVDPNMFGRGGVVVNPVAQMAMPMLGFLEMVDFLNREAKRIAQEFDVPWPPAGSVEADNQNGDD